jgi:hypothetical protein
MKAILETASPEEMGLAEQAVTGLAFGPRYLDEDGTALFESSTHTIIKLLRAEDVESSIVNPNGKEAEVNENAFDLLLPVIIISGTYISQHPDLVAISVNLISSYIHDFFTGVRGEKNVKCKILIKGKNGVKKISYKGPPEQFSEIKDILEANADEQ